MIEKQQFLKFILSKENKGFLLGGIAIGVIYFILLRYLYPIPSFFSDSYTYVGSAGTNQPMSVRPIQYSRMLNFFKNFSTSDIALIIAQYFSNLFSNLFLFFTCCWLFYFKRTYKVALYLLLVVNPFYILYSNYISPDAFFNGFAVLWFALLLWVVYKPSWLLLMLQVAVLLLLFRLRYNAIYFPLIMFVALLFSPAKFYKKVVTLIITIISIGAIIIDTTNKTESYAGTKTFSAFAGWQMANNAFHILPFENVDTANIKDAEVKHLLVYAHRFFDTTRQSFYAGKATGIYIWSFESPLRKYMKVYPGNKKQFFKTWNALGPVYKKVGRTIILQNPVGYLKHFVVPNFKAYLFPHLETYVTYFENRDTIPRVAIEYYRYKSNKVPPRHPWLYTIVFEPWPYIFPFINVLFVALLVWYVVKKKYTAESKVFNQSLLCFTCLFIVNFFFILLLAPSVLRYHIFIVTLLYPVLLYLLQLKLHANSVPLAKAN